MATCIVRESAQNPTLNRKYYPHIQMNKQRTSLDVLAQKIDDMLAYQNQWANAPNVDMFDAKQMFLA